VNTATDIENDLRRLFAEIPAPPAPTTWHPALSPRQGRVASPFRRRRSWLARRFAVAVPVFALVVGGVFLARREATQAPRPFSGLTVAALPAAAGLNCSLPISALSADHTTGFIQLSHGAARFSPVQTDGTTYIPQLGRWAPVLPQLVSLDGRSYVTEDYQGGQTIFSLVDAAGTHTLLRTTAPMNVFAYTSEGILLDDLSTQPGATGPADTLNLKVLDPSNGALRVFPHPAPRFPATRAQPTLPAPATNHPAPGGTATHNLTESGSAGYLRSGNDLWLVSYDSVSNVSLVDRYDLASGATSRWFDGTTDGHGNIQVVGADQQGAPIMQLSTTDLFHTDPAHRAGIGVQTLLLPAPHTATVLNGGRVGQPGVAGDLSPLSVTDGGMVWLAADDGAIWLYRPSAGLTEIAKVTTSTAGAPGVSISGPCR
jgi:hypothetical protein